MKDALELLGVDFNNASVRQFAVKELQKADDDILGLYLLQLVQAVKFEAVGEVCDSPLVQFLIQRGYNRFNFSGIKNYELGNSLYWYLMVETEDKQFGRVFAKVVYQFLKVLIEVIHPSYL